MIDRLLIELSEYRLDKAKEMLLQANLLHANKMYDGSVNRSYYSIFNAIRSILALAKLDSSKHSGVISYFDKYFVKTEIFEKIYSKIIHTAFDSRQDNDYEDFFTPSEEESEALLKDCEHFLDQVERKRQLMIDGKIELPKIGH